VPSRIEEHQDVLPDCRDELSESGSLSVSAWMKTSASSEMRPRACPRDHGCDQKGGGSSLSIVLPALNEEAGIEAVMNRIPRTILRGRGLSGSINLLDGPSTDWNTHDQEKRSQSTEALPPRRSSRSMPWYGARSDCSASTWNVLLLFERSTVACVNPSEKTRTLFRSGRRRTLRHPRPRKGDLRRVSLTRIQLNTALFPGGNCRAEWSCGFWHTFSRSDQK